MDYNSNTASAAEAPEVRPEGPYSFGCPAEEMYHHGTMYRQQVLDKARALANVTIPSVFPPDGYRTGDIIGEINQSIGASCVNTLASKLMFMALPPSRPVLKFEVIEHKLRKEIDKNPRLWTEIQIGLSRLEIEHRNRLEATNMRSAYVGATKAMLIGGNVCWSHLDIDHPIYYLMTHYVVKRSAEGEQLHVIVKQCKYTATLPKAIRAQVERLVPAKTGEKDYMRQADIYMCCRRVMGDDDKPHWEYWEECAGEVLDGTEMECDYDKPPLYAAWMIPVFGQDWGRSYCEEYEGDLLLVEGHSASINDGSAAASLLWLFLKPGSRTSARQLKKAGNMTVMAGAAEDITAGPDLTNKQRDFQFVANNLKEAATRLARAFLTMASIQRDAERVTAEEFSRMARELDQATGGMYSELAQTFQRVVVARFVALHNEDDKELPELPEGIFRVGVITGLEAMGRSVEGENLMRSTGGAMEVSQGKVAQYIDWHDFIRRIYMAESLNQDGLVRTPEAQAAFEDGAKKDAMKQTMMEKGVAPAINAAAKTGALPGLQQATADQQGQQAASLGAAPPQDPAQAPPAP